MLVIDGKPKTPWENPSSPLSFRIFQRMIEMARV
jgi:hypothetical protein